MENVQGNGARAAHGAVFFAKHLALLISVSVLWIQFHSFADLIVPVKVRPVAERQIQVDHVKQSLLKVGAPA